MMRQIAGSFAQHEKARVVAKLRAARERVRADKGKCGGRKSFQERDPQLERLARQLHRKGRGTKGLFVRSRASLPRWATSTVADSHTQRLALCSDKLVSAEPVSPHERATRNGSLLCAAFGVAAARGLRKMC